MAICRGLAPSARRRPISADRSSTATSVVFAIPTAPMISATPGQCDEHGIEACCHRLLELGRVGRCRGGQQLRVARPQCDRRLLARPPEPPRAWCGSASERGCTTRACPTSAVRCSRVPVTPRFSCGRRGSSDRMPITVNGWPPMKMAGSFTRLEMPSWAAAVLPSTATSCAVVLMELVEQHTRARASHRWQQALPGLPPSPAGQAFCRRRWVAAR